MKIRNNNIVLDDVDSVNFTDDVDVEHNLAWTNGELTIDGQPLGGGVSSLQITPNDMYLDDEDFNGVDNGSVFGIHPCIDFSPNDDGAIWFNFTYPESWGEKLPSEGCVELLMDYTLNGACSGEIVSLGIDMWADDGSYPLSGSVPEYSHYIDIVLPDSNLLQTKSISVVNRNILVSDTRRVVVRIKRWATSDNDTFEGTFQLINMELNDYVCSDAPITNPPVISPPLYFTSESEAMSYHTSNPDDTNTLIKYTYDMNGAVFTDVWDGNHSNWGIGYDDSLQADGLTYLSSGSGGSSEKQILPLSNDMPSDKPYFIMKIDYTNISGNQGIVVYADDNDDNNVIVNNNGLHLINAWNDAGNWSGDDAINEDYGGNNELWPSFEWIPTDQSPYLGTGTIYFIFKYIGVFPMPNDMTLGMIASFTSFGG